MDPMAIDKKRFDIARKRGPPVDEIGGLKTEKELELEQQLLRPWCG